MGVIGIAGAGAWGQALAVHAARAGHAVRLWARNPAALLAEDGTSHRLPGVALPPSIEIADELAALRGAELVLLAVPVGALRATASRIPGRAPWVTCCKGIEPGSLLLPLELLAAVDHGRPRAVLTGPTFAHEVAAGLPAAAVLAASDPTLAGRLAEQLGTATFRLYPGSDPIGAELGGAAKNVIAIAAGAASGAGFGENARAALITRGLAEIGRLAEGLGGARETVAGLSGAGDLVLTCTGRASRNHRLGVALGGGPAFARDGVAEGEATAPALVARAEAAGIDLPIARIVTDLLAGRVDPQAACRLLLARPAVRE